MAMPKPATCGCRCLIAKLADKHTVIAPDLRGFGESSAPSDGYTKGGHGAGTSTALVKSSQIRTAFGWLVTISGDGRLCLCGAIPR